MTTSLIDFILSLFRDHAHAEAFVDNPQQALQDAGLSHVSPAQLHSVVSAAAPQLGLGSGDPVAGLQRAVASHYNMGPATGPAMAPQPAFHGAAEATLMSHATAAASPVLSPGGGGGAVAQGGFSLGFGDITLGSGNDVTFGNKAVAMGDGATATGGDHHGDISNQIVSGDGAVLGDHNNVANGERSVAGIGNDVNSGDVHAGTGAIVNQGDGEVHNSGTAVSAGGDANVGNQGPVLKNIDLSGGHGGSAAGGDASAGSGLLGGGSATGGEANAGQGGSGGTLILNTDNSHHVGGNETNIQGSEMNGAQIDNSDDHSFHDDHSVHDYSTHDYSVHDNTYGGGGEAGGGGDSGGMDVGDVVQTAGTIIGIGTALGL